MESQEIVSQTTRSLRRMEAGEEAASEELYGLLYARLREMARGVPGAGARDHTLQPTALAHEVWIRLRSNRSLQAEVVDLRFFGGLTEDETAEAMDLTPRQVQHAWKLARDWLAREFEQDEDTDP